MVRWTRRTPRSASSLLSQALATGPYSNTFRFEFPSAVTGPQDELIIAVTHDRDGGRFTNDVFTDGVIGWLEANYPGDISTMFAFPDGGPPVPSITPESIELWAAYTEEFVAAQG